MCVCVGEGVVLLSRNNNITAAAYILHVYVVNDRVIFCPGYICI